jgi:MFS family permease
MPSAVSPNRSRLLFALLYLGEGAPIGFIWWALPTWLRSQGLPIEQITALTAVLVLPWVGKFLWAPLIDRIRDTRRGLRGCIVVAQLTMGATLLPLTWLNLSEQFEIIRNLLILHAFAAATQDVAVDALALRIVPAQDRGHLNGSMQAGMLIGRSVFGGGALVLSVSFGWPVLIYGLVGCVWLSTVAVLFMKTPEPAPIERQSSRRRSDFMAILQRRSLWIGLLFAGTAGAAYEAAGVLCGPMLVDRGISTDTVGWLFGLPVVGATIIGGLLGGVFADRVDRNRMIGAGIIGFAAMVLVLGGLNALPAVAPMAFFITLTGLYFCIGMFTVATYALFMELSRPPLAATQFSAFMSATNACEAWAGWVGGLIVSRFDYGMAFVVMSAVSLGALPLLRWLKPGNEMLEKHPSQSA